MDGKNCAKAYILESKIVILSSRARGTEKKGIKKMKPTFAMLLKTRVEKMSAFRLATILMKQKDL